VSSTARRNLRNRIYSRDGGMCFYCDTHLMPTRATLDHIIPRSQGGKNVAENCVIACRSCNNKRADRDAFAFLMAHRKTDIAPLGGDTVNTGATKRD
jgi:5-methylcytosine-specific restriction endonuclease McrA